METNQGNYDFLHDKLLVIHKELLSLQTNHIQLGIGIDQLKDCIGIYDSNLDFQLNGLINRLTVFNNSEENHLEKHAVFMSCKNEAISILTKFFFELRIEERFQ